MPSLYHFNSDQFKENLMLGGQQHMVAGRLCQYLKGWQLDGIRFLYKHFEKGEACILNDESGLGKVVTVSVFLGAILNNDTTKKCLIIVGDDNRIEGWRFHLSVLTQLSVKVIERISDINYETVFLIKWSTLKNIGQITQTTFDHIIIDNRGEMLTNKFCTGILLRYYENQTTLVISSSDVTADVKLLHILLRLCGRLDKQYKDVKVFENKFQLPKLRDSMCSKVDLEDYYLKREKVTNFCREFRLRRYCHQFEEEFPLVSVDEYRRHLEEWRKGDNSQSSGSVKLLSSSSEKDIEELFQAYFQVKKERDPCNLDIEVQGIMEQKVIDDEDDYISDEVVVMSPLFFISESESENESAHVQINTIEKLPLELKEDEELKENDIQMTIPQNLSEEIEKTEMDKKEKVAAPTKNRRKATKPLKSQPLETNELVHIKSLRSRSVRNIEKPPLTRSTNKKNVKQKTTDLEGKTPGSKHSKNQETKNEPNKEELKISGRPDKNVEEISHKKYVGEKKQPSSLSKLNAIKKIIDKGEKLKQEKHEEDIENLDDHKKTTSKRISSKLDEARSLSKLDKEKQGGPVNEKKLTNEEIQIEGKEVNVKKKKTKTKQENERVDKEAQINMKSSNWPVSKSDKTKQAKEEENVKICSKEKNRKESRKVQLNRVLLEAKKFLNNKHNRSLANKRKLNRKSTAELDSQVNTVVDTKKLKDQKRKSTTPKQCRTLTVYSPLGVHSRTTRGMQRHTRTCPAKNKYMKIEYGQVDIDKISLPKRRTVSTPKVVAQPPAAQEKPPVQVQVPLESPAILESMQLGQALTPTNGLPNTELIVPPQKKIDYNFPLMLDKEIAETECVIAPENNNANEIIILTGSSTTIEHEMEPPKNKVWRRKVISKQPMVTIPRSTYTRAKSPDLFSTCSDMSLPCSQQHSNKSNFEGFKLFGSELRKSSTSRSCLDILERMLEPKKTSTASVGTISQPIEKPVRSPQQHCIEDEDAMFEITSNCTFGNVIRVNSNGDVSPTSNKRQSTPPNSAHPKNRITNYLISNNQNPANTVPSTSSLEDTTTDLLQKTPKRRKSMSGTVKRSPRAFYSAIAGGKSQTTKLTQWLVKHTPTSLKPPTAKRRRLDLSFRDDK